MDRRTVIAITLCFLIYLGWHKLYVEPRMAQMTQAQSEMSQKSQNQVQVSPTQTQAPALAKKPDAVPEMKLSLSNSLGSSVISNGSAFFTDWSLNSYTLGSAADAAKVDLRSVTQQELGQVQLAFDDPQFAYLNTVRGKLTSTPTGAAWVYEDSWVKLTREFETTSQTSAISTRVRAEFKSRAPRFAFISVSAQSSSNDPEAQDRQLLYWHQSIEKIQLKDSIEQKQIAAPVKFIGSTNRYFLFSVVDQSPVAPNGLLQGTGPYSGRLSLVYPIQGTSIHIPLQVYFGPKEIGILKAIDPTLEQTVDFGWFTTFAYPILQLLRWLHQFVQNYGVAIILLTVILKVLTFPLNYKASKSMKKIAAVQPQLQKLREKYKDDREALNREMLSFMKNHGYNPMAGCLPVLVQMPVFFALYRVLYSSIELYHAPFAGWIQDLSSRDPYYITPVLLTGTMYIQQKLMPNTATDPAQVKMMQLLPIIFGVVNLGLPSGLTIYLLVNTIVSIGQQVFLNRKLGLTPQKVPT